MDETVSVALTGDISDLQSALEQAVAAINAAADEIEKSLARSGENCKAQLDNQQTDAQAFHQNSMKSLVATTDEAAQEAARGWQQANKAILTAEDSLVRDIFTKRQSLGRDLLQIAGHFLEQELSADLRYWTQRGLLALEGIDTEKTTEQSGVLMHGLMSLLKTQATTTSQTAQTAATETGVAARTSAEKAGQSAGLLTQVEAGSKAIMNDAYQAAAATWAAVAQIPVIGPFLAPPAAAAAFAGVMAFDALTALDAGAWEIPQNMPAFLHKGEMVVPENFASGLRGNSVSSNAAMTSNVNYSPTINLQNPQTWQSLLRGHVSDVVAAVNSGYRNGLPTRPSMRTL